MLNSNLRTQTVESWRYTVGGKHINLLNLQDHALDVIINETADRTSEYIIYHMTKCNAIPAYENTSPIHRTIYDKANMYNYELELQVKQSNPDCEFVGIKADCLVFNNAATDPPNSNVWRGIKKCDVNLIKQYTVN